MRMFLTGLALCLISVLAFAQEDQQPSAAEKNGHDDAPHVTDERPMSFWMEKKLDYSKEVLESLTKGDFDELADVAEKMQALSKLEGFVRRGSADYRTQLRVFEIANNELIRSAQRKSPEGALLAFHHLTSSCVACHTLLREGDE